MPPPLPQRGLRGSEGCVGRLPSGCRRMLLGQNMRAFRFPALRVPTVATGFPACCQLGALGLQGHDVAPVGLCTVLVCRGCLPLLRLLSDRAVNRCFFGGCALPPAAFTGAGATLPPWHGATQGPPVPWRGSCQHGGLVGASPAQQSQGSCGRPGWGGHGCRAHGKQPWL